MMNYSKWLLCTALGAVLSSSAAETNYNLSMLQQFAQEHEEYPASDNNNPIDPDYTAHHLSLAIRSNYVPTLLKQLGYWLGFSHKPLLYFEDCETIIARVVKVRQEKGFSEQHVVLSKDQSQRFLFWGNVQGAYHSLVRCLIFLKEQKIIDESLTIIDPSYRMVFLGNVAAHSPYILETVTVVALLMERNPDKVIYLQGQAESGADSLDQALLSQIRRYADERFDESIPLKKTLQDFFATLPLAAYVAVDHVVNKLIRLSSSAMEIPDQKIAELALQSPEKEQTTVQLKGLVSGVKNGDYRADTALFPSYQALIKNHADINMRSKLLGFEFYEAESRAAVWSIFSSPTKENQLLHSFFEDFFVELSLKSELSNVVLRGYHHDVRQPQDTFALTPYYNLLTGKKINELSKSLDAMITVGNVLDISSAIGRKIQ